MKPYILLIMLFFSGLGISVAQQRTRDILFPSFRQDLAALQEKESKQTATQVKDPRVTREKIFTDYHPQNNARSSKASTLKANSPATGKNPSDISAGEAAKLANAKQAGLPAQAIPVPTQGNASESSDQSKTVAPTTVTPPAKTAAPAAAPVKRSPERKKQ